MVYNNESITLLSVLKSMTVDREMDDWVPNAKSDNLVPKQIESQNKLNLGGRQLSPATIESQIIQIL